MDAAASFIADHLPGLFVGLLLLALAFTATLWHLVLRLRAPLRAFLQRSGMMAPLQRRAGWLGQDAQADAASGGYLLLGLVAGFLLVLGALSLFFAVADETSLDEDLGQFDHRLARALAATLPAHTLQFFATVTHLGDALTQYVLGIGVTLLLWFRRQRWLAASFAAAAAGNGLLNRALKAIFQRDRPLHEHGWASEIGWSFPSGHTSGAVAIYGMLAYVLIRTLPAALHLPIALGAIAVMLTVGFSRIALQVHYFSDVLAAFASAGAWLLVCIAFAEVMRARERIGIPRG